MNFRERFKEEVVAGSLVVHIGAKPNGFRARLVADIIQGPGRKRIIFADGNWDWLDQWRVFDGWKDYEGW